MGNRAVITTNKRGKDSIGIYLNWNGGPESVLAFLDTAKERGYRDPTMDESYGMARLVGVCHEFFGIASELSLGIGTLKRLDTDNYDNGTYIIGAGWTIVGRMHDRSNNSKMSVNDLTLEERKKYDGIMAALRESLKRNKTNE